MKPRKIQATFDIDTLKRIDRSKPNTNKLFKPKPVKKYQPTLDTIQEEFKLGKR